MVDKAATPADMTAGTSNELVVTPAQLATGGYDRVAAQSLIANGGFRVFARQHGEGSFGRFLLLCSLRAAGRREDFRKGADFNGPWECFGPESEASNNPLFLASVTLPYGILKDL